MRTSTRRLYLRVYRITCSARTSGLQARAAPTPCGTCAVRPLDTIFTSVRPLAWRSYGSSKQQAASSRQQAASSRQQAASSWQLAASSKQQAASKQATATATAKTEVQAAFSATRREQLPFIHRRKVLQRLPVTAFQRYQQHGKIMSPGSIKSVAPKNSK